ncbi:diguanylate cyclase [Tyzzerella sp. OttesenSCG-928-J15]|nr:diguanylate cyclase [Tyzzerella sp. OttesenSCG-928-J15]
MTNTVAIYISLPLVVVAIVITSMAYLTKREEPSCKYFLMLCMTVVIWNIFHLLYMSCTDLKLSELFFRMQMLVIPFTVVALLFYVFKFYGMDKYLTYKYIILFCIIPFITVILNFTNDYHHLFRIRFEVLQADPTHIILNERGPWFWVHTVYSYGVIIASNIISYTKIWTMPRQYRLPFYMVSLGCVSAVLFNLVTLLLFSESPVDTTLWGLTFGLFFLYFAMDSSITSNYMIARNEVFEAINEYIFVLNMKNEITDVNIPARTWVEQFSIEPDGMDFGELLEGLEENGAIIEKNENSTYSEVFFPEKENSLFSSYSLKKQYIYNKTSEPIGIIMTFSDITHMRETLRDLQEASSIDTLTGIYNRRVYERALKDYDDVSFLPLAVVIGDVNRLKYVNDTFGHSQGDSLLRTIAELLTKCAKGIGLVSRIGGDEFTIVVYGRPEEEIVKLIAEIRQAFKERESEMNGASIALGYAIKTTPEQNIYEIIEEADKRMYVDKENDRRRNRK